jgi:pilus assembly protein CpaE
VTPKPAVYEVLTEAGSLDRDAFEQATVTYRDSLAVFTAPEEILPLDLVAAPEIGSLLRFARQGFDIVVVDMPGALTAWTDTVIATSDAYLVVCELEVRSAQNAVRFLRLLEGEGLASDALGWVLNRAPGKLDMSGRARVAKMAETLGVAFRAVLPDGGRAVTEANDQARPLRDAHPRGALTKEIARLARDLDAEFGPGASDRDEAAGAGKPALGRRFG